MMQPQRIDHTAIAVRSIDEALKRYRCTFGLEASDRTQVEGQGADIAFIHLGNTQIELVAPTRSDSPVARFIERNGEGMHHIALQVEDIRAELQRLTAAGVELIDKEPRQGAHGLIAFLHPRAMGGVLYELVEHKEHSQTQP